MSSPRAPSSPITTTILDFSRVDENSNADGKPPQSTIETEQGTLHLQPLRKKGSKNIRALVTFVPRASTFDRENTASSSDPFRGFFTLFWVSVFLLSVRTYVTSFETSGYPLSLSFATLISKDAKVLLISDIFLVAATALVVPFMTLVHKGWIRYYWTGVVIQHIYQSLFLGCAVAWTFNRRWPWVQSGFFTLHSLTMLMKIHSYCSVNGHLSCQNRAYAGTLKNLRDRCQDSSIGGWDKAHAVALQCREEKALALRTKGFADWSHLTSDYGGDSTDGTPPLTSTRATLETSGLRQRLISVQTTKVAYASSAPPQSPVEDELDESRHILTHHPDRNISELANILTELQVELTSPSGNGNKQSIRWPQNINLWNFIDYQVIPTLVYEMQYPRTERLRPLYLLEKTVATFGTFMLLYTVTEHYIIPLTPNGEQPLLRSIIDLILPFMLCYLLLFYIIFECICNGFAELSFFADREFYEDWWNATTWDEYARRWNKPVHTFLLRHVYASTISTFGLSKSAAAFVTFLLSALAHELVMAVVTQKIRLYLFLLQMVQIPLIALGRLPSIRRNKTMGNIVFWLGLLTGFPLLCVAYCAY